MAAELLGFASLAAVLGGLGIVVGIIVGRRLEAAITRREKERDPDG